MADSRVGRDAAGRYLPGAAWLDAHPRGVASVGPKRTARRQYVTVCEGCGEDIKEAFADQKYHGRRCQDRARDKRLQAKGMYRDPRTHGLVRKMRQLTDAQRARLPIRDALKRSHDEDAYDPEKGNWSDPRQSRPGPAFEVISTDGLEDALARYLPYARYSKQVLGVLAEMVYDGRPVYSKGATLAQVLQTLLIGAIRQHTQDCRREDARQAFVLGSDHAKAQRIAKANGQGSQLEASLPGESAYLRFKRQNRADAQTPPEDAPLDQAR